MMTARTQRIAKEALLAQLRALPPAQLSSSPILASIPAVAGLRLQKLENGATVTSGDEIEVTLTVNADRDYEWLMMDDPLPSGFEPIREYYGHYGWHWNYWYSRKEFRDQKAIVNRVAAEVMKARGVRIKYLVGTMIEVPRGSLTADQIAREAEFFSFGTNDLTQMTFGFSRDDVGKFLRIYQDKKILEKDPFASIDVEGVGALVRMGVQLGRKTRSDLKIGVCGEHGGAPASIHFFQQAGLDYVSASPYRIPVARLAAAQAALSVKVGD